MPIIEKDTSDIHASGNIAFLICSQPELIFLQYEEIISRR